MNARVFTTAVGLIAGMLLPVSTGFSAAPPKLSGGIGGMVTNSAGIPQMGATVLLSNRFDRVLQRVLTTEKGTFGFNALTPDVYSVRVSLASFLPALKRNITVQPGMQSLLNVNLASVFSSIELVGVSPGQTSLMDDEWKWVLRSSSATRPVLRLFPELDLPSPGKTTVTSVFSDTRGVVLVSAGDEGDASALGSESDLGTAFALATSILGKNQLEVSGNIGYSSTSGAPIAAFRTSFRRDLGGGLSTPEVQVTMRQLSVPLRVGAAGPGESPVLRTLSAAMLDSKQVTDSVRLEYGMSMDSIVLVDRINYVSPFARLTYERKPGEAIRVGYASGTPPVEAFMGEHEAGPELQQDLSALALFPRMSLHSRAGYVQRMRSIEAGYEKKAGSRTYAAAAYNDEISNMALMMSGALDGEGGDLLPDLLTNTWTLNAGQHRNLGYMASVSQDVGEHVAMTLVYGSGAALTVDRKASDLNTPDDLRAAIRNNRQQMVTARVSGTAPRAGTQFAASYQWASVLALNPAHAFLTEHAADGPGLNIRIRQPIPYFSGLPGHMEATAEMRNLLAQGYVPLTYAGRRTYMMQAVRTLRGGVSFVF